MPLQLQRKVPKPHREGWPHVLSSQNYRHNKRRSDISLHKSMTNWTAPNFSAEKGSKCNVMFPSKSLRSSPPSIPSSRRNLEGVCVYCHLNHTYIINAFLCVRSILNYYPFFSSVVLCFWVATSWLSLSIWYQILKICCADRRAGVIRHSKMSQKLLTFAKTF